MLPQKRIRRPPKRYKDNDMKETSTPCSSVDERSCGSPPCNTIESSVSLPFEANTWRDVREKLESITWIQCDNPGCLKWRKVPSDHAAGLTQTDKWLCSHNPDPQFNRCEVPEEDVDAYDQLAVRSGLRYLKSELPPGALVWARMHGYCSWPAIVTPEPGTDNGHAWLNEEGEEEEVAQYHVEFLGKPHSHAWVSARKVDTLTASSATDPGQSEHTKGIAVSVSRQTTNANNLQQATGGGRGLRKCKRKSSQRKTTYSSGSGFQQAVSEALCLLPLSPAQRLQACVYVSSHSCFKRQRDSADDRQATAVSTAEKAVSSAKKRGKGRIPKRKSAEEQAAEPSTPPSYTAFTSSLEGRSKEERLMLDVEMYRSNERAFEHDVTRFLIRNGLKVCSKGPVWHNQSVSLFHLFLAVHERGGFAQVTQRRGWASVYREVTNMYQSDIHKSQSAKDFYRRYLYPYELYIRGEDFNMCNSHPKQKMNRGKKQNQTCVHTAQSGTDTLHNKTEEEDDIMSDSLREMLQALEENSKLALDDTGVDITFYDESTPDSRNCKLPLALYENQASPPQVVPTAASSLTVMEVNKTKVAVGKTTSQCLQELQNADTLHFTDMMDCQQQYKHQSRNQEGRDDSSGNKQRELPRQQSLETSSIVDTSLYGRQRSSPCRPTAGSQERRLCDSGSSVSAFSQLLDQINALQKGIDFSDTFME